MFCIQHYSRVLDSTIDELVKDKSQVFITIARSCPQCKTQLILKKGLCVTTLLMDPKIYSSATKKFASEITGAKATAVP